MEELIPQGKLVNKTTKELSCRVILNSNPVLQFQIDRKPMKIFDTLGRFRALIKNKDLKK